MVLKARKLKALEDEQNAPRNAQIQENTLAQTPKEKTPTAFIEEVLNEEENLVHIKTMALEQMDTLQPEEEIPRSTSDPDNDDPEEGPSQKMATPG